LMRYSAIDIAYIVLDRDAPVTGLPRLTPVDSDADRLAILFNRATLVGYGSDHFVPSQSFIANGSGTKRVGEDKQIIQIAKSFLVIGELAQNFLRGDSGGPVLFERED